MTTGSPSATPPPKVVGMGAPISVWIYFEVSEIPALIDAIGDERARYRHEPQIGGPTVEPEPRVDPAAWRDHVGELERMLGDLEQAAKTRTHGRFDVLWPTALANGVLRGAIGHAERRVAAAVASDATAARDALAAAQQTLRDFQVVDRGGLLDAWL